MTPAEHEPTTATVGDSIAWRRELVEYPADTGWTVTYALRGPASEDVVAVADGAAHLVELAAAATAAWTAGRYLVVGFASKGADRVTFYRGELLLAPDPTALADGSDVRSYARRVLEAIEAVIERRATKDQASYQIDGRALNRAPLAELFALRDRFRAEVAREEAAARIAAGLGNPRRRVLVRFGRGF